MTGYERWRPKFADALDQRYHPIEWIDWAVASGVLAGFYGRESALLAELKRWPGGALTAGVFFATGDQTELTEEIRPCAEAWARSRGADEIVIEGRKGWARALAKHGYRHEKTTVAKGL